MGSWLYRKPEPVNIQGMCVSCEIRLQTTSSKGKYRALCNPCHKSRYFEKLKYKSAKSDTCNECGFKAVHSCQLDVDHIDGDKTNNEADNLQTLCANCHRLKTLTNGDFAGR